MRGWRERSGRKDERRVEGQECGRKGWKRGGCDVQHFHPLSDESVQK